MARKAMMIDDTLEFDPTVQTEADEARAEIAEAQRAARRSKGKDKTLPAVPDRPTAAILPIYLREMGATPLIDETKEVELARELQEAREALSKIALRLPAYAKEYVLEGDYEGPKRGREWPLDDLVTFYGKLSRFSREQHEAKITAAFKSAREHKRHVDHARDALILANLRLVVHIAKKYLNHGISFMDLIQEGNIGLMKAVEKFEYERGNKFSTYAYWWIKQAIERAIADKARIIRIPVHVNEKIKKIARVSRELGETLGPRELLEHRRVDLRAAVLRRGRRDDEPARPLLLARARQEPRREEEEEREGHERRLARHGGAREPPLARELFRDADRQGVRGQGRDRHEALGSPEPPVEVERGRRGVDGLPEERLDEARERARHEKRPRQHGLRAGEGEREEAEDGAHERAARRGLRKPRRLEAASRAADEPERLVPRRHLCSDSFPSPGPFPSFSSARLLRSAMTSSGSSSALNCVTPSSGFLEKRTVTRVPDSGMRSPTAS